MCTQSYETTACVHRIVLNAYHAHDLSREGDNIGMLINGDHNDDMHVYYGAIPRNLPRMYVSENFW